MRIALLADHDLRRDLRPRRCARALAAAGHQVTVHGVLTDGAEPEEDEGEVVLVRTALADRQDLVPVVRAALARETPDAFHAIGFPLLAEAAAAARSCGRPLVLDRPGALAVESELAELERRPAGLRGLVRRTRLRARLRDEQRLAARVRRDGLAAVLTGSAALAARLAAEHGVPHPIVVRDCLPWSSPPPPRSLRVRVGADPESRLLVYRGGGGPASGLEAAIRSLRVVGEHAVLVLLGWSGTRDELTRLEELAERHGVRAQLRTLPPAPPEEVRALLASADAALLPTSPRGAVRGARIPAALFEYLSAGVPVVASDPGGGDDDVAGIVRDTGAGVLFAVHGELDPGALAEAVRTLLDDEDLAATCRDLALRAASADLCWEVESRKLVAAYERLGSQY